MNRIVLVLVLMLGACGWTGAAGGPVEFLLARRPALAGGGATPATFAAWANARHLLGEACYLGPVASAGAGIEAHLFIGGDRPILVCWARNGEAAATVRAGRDAKLYARGARTGPLPAGRAALSADAVPLFLRGADPAYLAEAMTAALSDEAEWSGAAAPSGHRTAALDALAAGRYREALARLRDLDAAMTAFMRGVAEKAASDRPARFALLRRLLLLKMTLADLRTGLGQWLRAADAGVLASTAARLKLREMLQHLLAQAEPATALHGYPVTGALLRGALADLAGLQESYRAREANRLDAACGSLPVLLALEAPAAQNLPATATVTIADGASTLHLLLRNSSAEEAVGSVRFSWDGGSVEKQFRLAAGASGELLQPLEHRPAPGFTVWMDGALADATPIPRRQLSCRIQP